MHDRAVKRIVFETVTKFTGKTTEVLSVANIKQIAGRAGRYSTAHQDNQKHAGANNQRTETLETGQQTLQIEDKIQQSARKTDEGDQAVAPLPPAKSIGLVTTLEDMDYPIAAKALMSEPEPIESAGIFPPNDILERFCTYFPPNTPFSYIILRLHDISRMHPRYFLCGLASQLAISDAITDLKLTVQDKLQFIAAPANPRHHTEMAQVREMAKCVEKGEGSILDIPQLRLDLLGGKPLMIRDFLRQLEVLHRGVILYIWLSYRIQGVFNNRALAFHIKELVEDRISEVLAGISSNARRRREARRERRKALMNELQSIVGKDKEDQHPDNVREEPVQVFGTRGFDSGAQSSAHKKGVEQIVDEEDVEVEIDAGGHDRYGQDLSLRHDERSAEPDLDELDTRSEMEAQPSTKEIAVSLEQLGDLDEGLITFDMPKSEDNSGFDSSQPKKEGDCLADPEPGVDATLPRRDARVEARNNDLGHNDEHWEVKQSAEKLRVLGPESSILLDSRPNDRKSSDEGNERHI